MVENLSKGKIGIAGEFFVAAELSMRGYIATVTLRNTKNIDILVSSEEGDKVLSIQVKTTKNKRSSWPMSRKHEEISNKNLFYVFVKLKGIDQRPDFYVVPSKDVSRFLKKDHADWLAKPGRNGEPHKDNDIRQFRDLKDKYKERWELLNIA